MTQQELLSTSDAVVAAIDVGGTRIKSALVDRRGIELVAMTEPTPRDLGGSTALSDALANIVTSLVGEATRRGETRQVLACGVAVPGLVDAERGIARYSTNLGWRDVDVLTPLRAVLGIPVAVGNDVRAGLMAEGKWGAARNCSDVLFIPLGTGIAGALMVDGRVLDGQGHAGELGHVQMDPEGPPCHCGGRGCLETISSASAIQRAYAARKGLDDPVGADVISGLVAAGDPVASAVWAHAVDTLARAVVMVVTLTGARVVIVGGGLAESGEILLSPLRRSVAEAITFQHPSLVVAAHLGDRAGCLGAACLAWGLV